MRSDERPPLPGAAEPAGAAEPGADAPQIDAVQSPAEAASDLQAALEAARAEAQENYDRFLRAAAELDNYRKRTARVRTDVREEVLRDIVLQVAPVLDNLGRALAQESGDVERLKQGVVLIQTQLQDVLRGYGLEAIEAQGQPFDPQLHEALMQVPHPDHAPGTVVEVVEKGYTLNSKVVRPSRVVVSRGMDAEAG